MEIYLIYGTYEYSSSVDGECKNLYVDTRKEKALEILHTNHQKYGNSGYDYRIETWKDEVLTSSMSAKELFGEAPSEHINPQPTFEFWRDRIFAEIEQHLSEVTSTMINKFEESANTYQTQKQ